jgi:nucleoside-diphosphate-sugar epimerase
VILAVTGATGFVGRRTLDHALAAGHRVRALTRRPQPAREGVTWVEGSLDSPGPLTEGADAVIHIAGVVNAPDRAGFAAGNVEGTRTVLRAAGEQRFVHVSSLSAREPQLSNYGWSKAEGERIVREGASGWTIVRPPAVYGPGDTEMRDLFRAAKLGLAILPPPGRASFVHVDDLARLLVALAERPGGGELYEPDDGSGGVDHLAFGRLLGQAVGRRVLPLSLPRALLALAAGADRLLRGDGAKLTADRVAYLSHPDWTVDPARRPPPALWRPEVPLAEGLAATARWYAERGLL